MYMNKMLSFGVNVVFHYVPLHSSILGRSISRISGSMSNTENISNSIIRLPFWIGLDPRDVVNVVNKVCHVHSNNPEIQGESKDER